MIGVPPEYDVRGEGGSANREPGKSMRSSHRVYAIRALGAFSGVFSLHLLSATAFLVVGGCYRRLFAVSTNCSLPIMVIQLLAKSEVSLLSVTLSR